MIFKKTDPWHTYFFFSNWESLRRQISELYYSYYYNYLVRERTLHFFKPHFLLEEEKKEEVFLLHVLFPDFFINVTFYLVGIYKDKNFDSLIFNFIFQ